MGRKSHKESAIFHMTDLHFGKRTSTFSSDKFEAKLDAIGERLKSIRGAMTGYDFDELVIPLTGDVNDGTGIYPTQAHHQDITNVEEQADQLSDLLAAWYRDQLKTWKKIRIECVPGNHGRAGKFAHEGASWDMVAYKYLASKLRDVIPVHWNRNDKFIRTISVRKHRYLLYHGHDIKTFSNIPWYGMLLRLAKWNTTKLAPFDVALMGHFHTCGDWTLNRIRLLLSGTMISDDEWALQSLGWESANKWWLFGANDERPVTWSFAVDV